MCSVTIFMVGDELVVTMNRDESVLREQELPPQQHEAGCYPIDKTSGGTWCGLSKQGRVYCLLNRYDGAKTSPTSSRGHIIPSLLGGADISDYSAFDSFSLITYGAGVKSLTAWNGKQVVSKGITSLPYFFSSSSLRKAEVLAYRRNLFNEFVGQNCNPMADDIFAFHRRVDNNKEYGIFVERDNAHSKSVLQFVIGKVLHYNYYRRDGFTQRGQL